MTIIEVCSPNQCINLTRPCIEHNDTALHGPLINKLSLEDPQGILVGGDLRVEAAQERADAEDAAERRVREGERSAQREEMGKLRQVHREAVEKVLTAAQREKLAVPKDEAFYRGKHRYRMR